MVASSLPGLVSVWEFLLRTWLYSTSSLNYYRRLLCSEKDFPSFAGLRVFLFLFWAGGTTIGQGSAKIWAGLQLTPCLLRIGSPSFSAENDLVAAEFEVRPAWSGYD